jgi:hypothetical protein
MSTKRCFMMSKGHSNAFYKFGHSKSIWTKSRKWWIKKVNGPENSLSAFWTSEKTTLMKSMKRYFKVSKGHANKFCSSRASKKRLGRSLLSYVLCKRMTLETPNLPSGRLKNRIWWSWLNNVSRCRKIIRTHFLHPEHGKKRLGWIRLSDILCRRMALRTNNLPSERLKMRLRCCRWRDVSCCLKAIRTHFLNLGHSKKRLERIRGSDIWSKWMVLRTDNLSSGHFKERLWLSRWSYDSMCQKAIRAHILHTDHRIKRLGWIRLCWLNRRMDLRTNNLPSESLKMRLRCCRWSDGSCCRKAIRTYFLHSGHFKKRFGQFRGSDVLCSWMALRTHNLPSGRLKKRLW